MLLKDCPVGSVVRCTAWGGDKLIPHYVPTEITVKEEGVKYFIDTEGMKWHEFDCLKDDFEIVHPAPEPRITFTVGGQEFYVGQRVWSTEDAGILKNGEEAEIVGAFPEGSLYGRKLGDWKTCILDPKYTSTTPPMPYELKRGDWARHKDGRTAFVCGVAKLHGEYGPISLMVSFESEAITNISASEFTFISHSEPPE